MAKIELWAHSTQPEFELLGCTDERVYVPSRVMTCIPSGYGRIILPDTPLVRDWARFCCRELPLAMSQVLWVSGTEPLLDHDIVHELMDELKSMCRRNEVAATPYSATEAFTLWAGQLSIRVEGDAPAFTKRFADKSVLHPEPNRERAVELPEGVKTARGYTCRDVSQLLLARKLLAQVGVDAVILKPCLSSAGDGIIPDISVRELREYRFPFGHVILEECLEVDLDAQGKKIEVSVQYRGQEIMGPVTDQVMHDSSCVGNATPSLSGT